VSDSERPIDVLLASLLSAKSAESAEVKEVLGEDVAKEELDRVQRAIAAMARTAEAAEPPADGLLAARGMLVGPRRLDRFAETLGRFFDFGETEAAQLLARIDAKEEWMEGPDAGISILPVQAGPGAASALASLVQLPPGVTLGEHAHVGRELLLVLEGGLADSQGHVVWPGETLEMAAGTSHSMWGLPGPVCICAALLFMDSGDGAG
jgi:putative transcriptional regulator